MPPRYSWKGFVRLSLVTIPVRWYNSAESSKEIHFNQLHKPPCSSRIQYRKVCPVHGEVPREEIVSGYPYAKDQYVVVDEAELDKLYRESDKGITIDGFIPPGTIDPAYFTGRTNYLLPDGAAGAKPYQLLREGMAEEDLVAISRMVLRGREELVLLRPVDKLLAATMVSYAQDVRGPEVFEDELVETEAEEDEVALTRTLIAARRIEDFDLSRYRDTYDEKLHALIEAKVQGKEIVAAPSAPEEPRVINLMDALKKSLAEAGAGAETGAGVAGGGERGTAEGRKMAPSARSTRPAGKKKRKTG